VNISPRDVDDDELSAHLLGLRAALLTAAEEDADDTTFEGVARSIKDCRGGDGAPRPRIALRQEASLYMAACPLSTTACEQL